jgi:hypothetical protein
MLEITTKDSDKTAFNLIREAITSVANDIVEERYRDEYKPNSKGTGTTLGQDAFYMTDLNTGETLWFVYSVARWDHNPKGGRAKGIVPKAGMHSLAKADVDFLESALATVVSNGDIELAGKLNSIKDINKQFGGVTEEQRNLLLTMRFGSQK